MKYILNTTFVFDRHLQPDVVDWLKNVYMPAALATSIFSSPRMAQVLTDEHPETISIACELTAESLSEAVRWHDTTAGMLFDDLHGRWGTAVMCFSTYLKQID